MSAKPPEYIPRKKNELRVNHNTFEERQRYVMDQLSEILGDRPELLGIKPETCVKLHGHDHALINDKLGVGGFQYEATSVAPMRVKIEHMGLKAYRIRYEVPDAIFWRVVRDVECTVDTLRSELERAFKDFR